MHTYDASRRHLHQDIDWHGSNNQVRAALDAGVDHILLVSSMGTTEPNSFLDLIANGHILFFKLNGEIDLMGSGAPYTVVKPGGLLNDEGANTRSHKQWWLMEGRGRGGGGGASCIMHHSFPLLHHNHNHQCRYIPIMVLQVGRASCWLATTTTSRSPASRGPMSPRSLLQAILRPELSKWTRFDLSSDSSKPATGDFEALF